MTIGIVLAFIIGAKLGCLFGAYMMRLYMTSPREGERSDGV